MLDARAIFRLLIEDDPPATPPDDPRQMGLDFNPDDLDTKSEIFRYAEKFRIPGDGPTTTYQRFQERLGGRDRKKIGNNTYLINHGNKIPVLYHRTEVVTAYTDGKVVVDAGGWHPQGRNANYGWRAPAGKTTRERICEMAGTAGGWDIMMKDSTWYWFNRTTGRGNWTDTEWYPYTDRDTIHPDGSLEIQAEPLEKKAPSKTGMNARETIELVVEGKAPQGWATTRGVYANLSNYPHEIQYYVKCPKCGLVHGNFKSMKDAHAKKLCDVCNLDAINKLKDEIQDVVHDPDHKPKEMSKIIGEAEFDPFDTPPEGEGLPVPPEDQPSLDPSDIKGEIDRLLMGNWVDVALRQFSEAENLDLSDIEIDESWSERHGNFDRDNLNDTEMFKVEIGNLEYLIFKSEDQAEAYALEIVRNDLKTEPGVFSQDWLRDFVDKDKLAQAIGDPNENWEEEVNDLDYDDLLDKMVEEGYVESDDSEFFDEDGDHKKETKKRAAKLDTIRDDYIEKEKPEPPDPWDWLEDVYGKEEAQKQAIELAGIDIDKAAESAVSTDGWPHFVARYDGHSHTLEDGAVYCRDN